jgi:hypothetical protein
VDQYERALLDAAAARTTSPARSGRATTVGVSPLPLAPRAVQPAAGIG